MAAKAHRAPGAQLDPPRRVMHGSACVCVCCDTNATLSGMMYATARRVISGTMMSPLESDARPDMTKKKLICVHISSRTNLNNTLLAIATVHASSTRQPQLWHRRLPRRLILCTPRQRCPLIIVLDTIPHNDGRFVPQANCMHRLS